MLYPLKAIISKKIRKDGKSLVHFQYCYSSTNRILLSSDVAVPQLYWSKKRQQISKSLPVELGDYLKLNDEISRVRKIIEALIDKGASLKLENLGQYVKEHFNTSIKIEDVNQLKTTKEVNFFHQLDLYIQSKETTVSSVASFKCMKERLVAFQAYSKKLICFKEIDYNFYLDLVDFLTYHYKQKRKKEELVGLKVSTLGKTIKNLRMFIKDRVRRKIIEPINTEDFKGMDEESDAIYLSFNEISKIYHLNLTIYPHLLVSRDMFILGCLTGLRFSDYSTLSFTDMRGNMLYKKTEKTDSWAVVPMMKEAKDCFVRLFRGKTPIISNPVFNKNIKEIGKIAEIKEPITFSYKKGNKDVSVTKAKYNWITSHTCRRSFCTNEFLMGTDVNLIMKISGHKNPKDFFRYIKITEVQAAEKIQEVWLKRNEMTALDLK